MSKGFVTFIDSNPIYVGVLETLIRSLLLFSEFPIHVFCINYDLKLNYPNLIKSNINLKQEQSYDEWLMYFKFYAAINNGFDFGCIIDADMIANINIDDLLTLAEKECTEFPIAPFHGDNCNCDNVMNYLGIKNKTIPYVHGTYLFSKQCKPFLQECYDLSRKFLKINLRPMSLDETILNCLLWKHKANKYLNSYDPYYKIFQDYILNNNNTTQGQGRKNISFHLFHGCKDKNESLNILNKLEKQNILDFINNKFQNNKLKIYN